jgi:Flp pilus assembly protein TadG
MSRSRRGENGQELVEFALIVPLLLLIVFGICEFAVAVFSYDAISNAAREGARFGAISANSASANGATQTCVSPTNPIVQRTCRLTAGLRPEAIRVTPTRLAGVDTGRQAVRVVVSYDSRFVSGLVIAAVGGDPELRLNAAASMQIE